MKITVFLVIFCAIVNAQTRPLPTPQIEYHPRAYSALRVSSELTIDGQLNEAAWHRAQWSNDFVDIKGGDSSLPRYQTRFKLLWDDHYFYIGAELEEPHIWATISERDAVIYFDNDFEVFIDPDGDTHNYFEIEINALNTVWDLFLDKPYRDGAHPLNGWDIKGLKTAVHVAGTLNDPSDTDRAWFVEMAVPWQAFQFSKNKSAVPRLGDQWRVNFSRVQWHTEVHNGQYTKRKNAGGRPLREENWVWSPQGLIAMHYPEMWGFVSFAKDSVRINPDPLREQITALLWQIYYQQKNQYRAHGAYAGWKELPLSQSWPEGIAQPRLYVSPSLWEARIADEKSGLLHCIRFDGLIWREPFSSDHQK